ncbi:CRE-SCO-1 protein [Aphelenchoides avenae]|nr:CRE-SCO-1 protein [Aphelenchus avenae]
MHAIALVHARRALSTRIWRTANVLSHRWQSSSSSSSDGGTDKKDPTEKKPLDDLNIDVSELTKQVNQQLNESVKKDTAGDEIPKDFMNFSEVRQRAQHERSYIFSWKPVIVAFLLTGATAIVLYFMRRKRLAEREQQQKMMAGKARIGGEWELLNTDGKLEGSKDLRGNWLLLYFGFTNCPDICPDEIEKMIEVVDMLDREEKDKIPVIPVFISVDPERDTIERVKKYCAEFSPKLRGFTGNKEQVAKVAKTFRVYHSEGPKTTDDDYIVDHTVIMYLIDPEGNFHDYYGQNRRAREIANVIRTKVLQFQMTKKNSWI